MDLPFLSQLWARSLLLPVPVGSSIPSVSESSRETERLWGLAALGLGSDLSQQQRKVMEKVEILQCTTRESVPLGSRAEECKGSPRCHTAWWHQGAGGCLQTCPPHIPGHDTEGGVYEGEQGCSELTEMEGRAWVAPGGDNPHLCSADV